MKKETTHTNTLHKHEVCEEYDGQKVIRKTLRHKIQVTSVSQKGQKERENLFISFLVLVSETNTTLYIKN